MKDMKDFYILGIPIETEIGLVDFLKVREYPDYFIDLQIMSLSKQNIIYKYSQINKDGSLNELISEIQQLSLFDIVISMTDLKSAYTRVFTKVFGGEESVALLNVNNFEYYRKLVLTMNCVNEEVVNPNPEIQRALERSRRVKNHDGEKLEFADIVTSVVGFNGQSYKDINEFTIYQLYMTFYRIGQIKNYDTTTLFATVSNQVKIENWNKHINPFEEEKHFITKDAFDKKSNSIFGN